MKTTIESLDHYGRGICYINNKITFVPFALPEEEVLIKITKETKKYNEGEVLEYLTTSKERIPSSCPYFLDCGGCSLFHLEYSKTLEFKKKKVEELLLKNKIDYKKELKIISNPHNNYYRNKVSLKIMNGNIGYYKKNSHILVPIKKCLVANSTINTVIDNYSFLHLDNANLTIRVNQNKEVLLIIDTLEENYSIDLELLKEKVKLVGIVYNNKSIYGDDFLYERINGFLFKISYNSFFQVNPYICSILFDMIKENIEPNSRVLDLYSGVGTLGLVASLKAKEVYSVEIISNAILNGILNAKINKRDNIKFLLGDVSKTVDKLNKTFDTIIVDPPRSGLDKHTISFLLKELPKKIIYVSCDPSTLMRDLKQLESSYKLEDYQILDMFSYSYHLESICILKRI